MEKIYQDSIFLNEIVKIHFDGDIKNVEAHDVKINGNVNHNVNGLKITCNNIEGNVNAKYLYMSLEENEKEFENMKEWDKIEKRKKEIKSILENTLPDEQYYDNVLLGLLLLSKYCKKKTIISADVDVVYSISLDDAIYAGIKDEDIIQLAKLNWTIDEFDGFACFI